MNYRFLLFALCLLVPSATAAEPRQIIGVASVIDGDTIEIHASAFACSALMPPKAANSAFSRPVAIAVRNVSGRRRWSKLQEWLTKNR